MYITVCLFWWLRNDVTILLKRFLKRGFVESLSTIIILPEADLEQLQFGETEMCVSNFELMFDFWPINNGFFRLDALKEGHRGSFMSQQVYVCPQEALRHKELKNKTHLLGKVGVGEGAKDRRRNRDERQVANTDRH